MADESRCIVEIDGVRVELARGENLLAALDAASLLAADDATTRPAAGGGDEGVSIPHFCWHPKLSVDGSCRLCQVEVEGMPGLQIACRTAVHDGMVVRTQTDEVRDARAGVMEFLLLNHPLDCPICDQAGECKLQDFAFEHAGPASRSREPRRALGKRIAVGPRVVLDQERCILCRRCVRFCREVPGTGELGVFGRGDASLLQTFPGDELDNDYSMCTADICPVGALTTRDFRFKRRVWDLEQEETVCTGCARGCNVHVGTYRGQVVRQLPRRNDAVNETWICDHGRLLHHELKAEGRLRAPAVRGSLGALEPCALDEAIDEAAQRLFHLVETKGVGVVAGLASGHATNEDLFVLRQLLDGLGVETMGLSVATGASDDILITEEKAANGAGARALGFGDPTAIYERVLGGGIDGLIVLGHDLLEADDPLGVTALERLDTIVLLDTHRSPLEEVADVVLPVRASLERDGSVTNVQGRVQRLRAVVPAPPSVPDQGEVLSRLATALGLPGFDEPYDVVATSRAASERVASFAGRDLSRLGSGGLAGPADGESA